MKYSMTCNYYTFNFATETQQVKAYNVQPELIDSLLIEIIENIWSKVEGESVWQITKITVVNMIRAKAGSKSYLR